METPIDPIAELAARIDKLQAEVARLRPSAPKRSEYVEIGEDTKIAHGVKLWGSEGKEIHIGNNVNIHRGAEILGPVTIGDNCLLSRDAYIRAHTIIGNHVALGPFVRLITDTHHIGSESRRAGKARIDPITIGDGAWIGAGSIILPGVTIGAGVIVGAGSIVTKDIPANAKAYGSAASIRGSM